MRIDLAALVFMGCTNLTAAQELDIGPLVEELNRAIAQEAGTASDVPATNQMAGSLAETGKFPVLMENITIPNYGIVVKDKTTGKPLELFGEIPYDVDAGQIMVPGYAPPANGTLEILTQGQWADAYATIASAKDVDPSMAPITKIPGAVFGATEFLATNLCGIRGRPSSLSLLLTVSVGGTVFFVEAGGETGSEVTWDLKNDTCSMYGLEGDGIAFRDPP